MLILILFAFLAGVVTVLSPCILPVLPVILSGSAGGGKARPIGIISGFIISFTVFTLTLSAIVSALGISADILRWIAAVLILIFGLVMVVPPLKKAFMSLASRLAARDSQKPGKGNGYFSGLILGLSLGLVWTPCVGPIMASVITLALTASVDFGSVLITVAYSFGTAIPLFLIMIGGRTLLQKHPFFTKHSEKIHKGFGILMLVAAIAIFSGLDRQFQTFILDAFPGYGSGLTAIEDQEFIKEELEKMQSVQVDDTEEVISYSTLKEGGPWINSEAIDPEGLKGKVVLIDFWTYSCINCIRTLPYLTAWDRKYRENGLVIIGVHSPEFAFEKEEDNVRDAVNDFNIEYPVVLDNEFKIWRSFHNRYWPAHYFFDKNGKLVYQHFGEGKYEESERMIQQLLNEAETSLVSKDIISTYPTTQGRTPETYLGFRRAENFASPEEVVKNETGIYSIPENLLQNNWALSGKWIIGSENITADGAGMLEIYFNAKDVYLVLGPVTDDIPQITVTVDNVPVNTTDIDNGALELDTYRLYELFRGESAVKGLLRLETKGPVNAYAFTFG